MAFQRSYSKVWWGSDNQLSAMSSSSSSSLGSSSIAGSSFTSGGYYSYFSQQHHHLNQQQLQQQQAQEQQQQQQFSRSNGGYHSLDYNNLKSYNGNLSRIQEVDDEQNISKISWEKRDSPGSLRSQDSGFSDNDESHSTRSLGGRSSKTSSPSSKSDMSNSSNVGSPTASVRTIATPPTVIRRVGKSEFYSPLVSVSRRISFSGSPASGTQKITKATSTPQAVTAAAAAEQEDAIGKGAESMAQLDDMQLVNGSSTRKKKLNFDGNDFSGLSEMGIEVTVAAKGGGDIDGGGGGVNQRRRRRVSRKPTKPLTPTKKRTLLDNNDVSEDDDEIANDTSSSRDELTKAEHLNGARSHHNHTVPEYNNETVYLGSAESPQSTKTKAYNNETVILDGRINEVEEDTNNNTYKLNNDDTLSPLRSSSHGYTASTSTPKAHTRSGVPKYDGYTIMQQPPACHEYDNPLLNGHQPALQHWLNDIRMSYEHEVLSTLQTKSIVQEAFKNLTITTNTVAKLIRQLQQRAMYMQSDFERIERLLSGNAQTSTLHETLLGAQQLLANVAEFTNVLERRSVFFTDSRVDRKKFEDAIQQIRIITKDTSYSLQRQQYISIVPLLDDVQVLKRFLLISVRLVFEKMVHVIVLSIENGRCDLMLRANINMIATLTNIDYEGFASLTGAFVQNEAVRTLLIVVLEHRLSSVRALALRALATICCAPAAIAHLGSCGGIEIVRDILQVQGKLRPGDVKRADMERREAVSLLTQITAGWHGPEHRVDGLKDCVETIVEGLTQLTVHTGCPQTLLLCAAALNNLSRIEITSHYSIMSNEAIAKLIQSVENKEEAVSIFLYEQIVAMLHNMSLNKKCHSHLANGSIINFITSAYQTEFYKSYNSRAESDAQRRTIKAILHTLTRLVHDSSLGVELLEQHHVPAFFKMSIVGSSSSSSDNPRQLNHHHLYNSQDGSSSSQSHSRDISMLARQLLFSQKQELIQQQNATATSSNNNTDSSSNIIDGERETMSNNTATVSGLKFNLTRQESFV